MINLSEIKDPQDLHNLTVKDLEDLALQSRQFLLENVSKTGGHLASNLGVVELTLALHKNFNSPQDKIVWDVGHQGYIHKMVTGRQDGFKSLRKYNGMSGFLKSSESKHDVFDAGHSSTSISAALGYAKAMRLKGQNHHAVAVIGDGALTGGMAFEALNYAGHSKENIIIILNDNEMSISDNVGAISSYLNKIRTNKTYFHLKLKVNKAFRKIPIIGQGLVRFFGKLKNSLKQFVVKGMLFEEFGFHYVGLADGHDIQRLNDVFEHVKDLSGPILVHVSTQKGRGYSKAEASPHQYHGVSKFDLDIGLQPSQSAAKYQDVMGDTLIKLREEDDRIVAFTAAMPGGTGLMNYSKLFPDHFVDVGIAEQHAVTMAAGMAKEGMKPFVCVYSTFLQRAYDQIVHDVCLQDLNVTFCIDRAGLVGEDGETHHGILDIAYLSHIPNMTILAPKDGIELQEMLKYSLTHNGPLAIRYPRGTAASINESHFTQPTYEVLTEGKRGVIVAVGKMVESALKAKEILKTSGYELTVINPRQLVPAQDELIRYIHDYDYVFTIEDHMETGGYGSYLRGALNKPLTSIALNNHFVEHGDVESLFKHEGLDVESIVNTILEEMRKNG